MSGDGPLSAQIRLLIIIDQLDRALVRCLGQREEIRRRVKVERTEIEALQQRLTSLESQQQSLTLAQQQRERDLKWTQDKLARIGGLDHVTTERELEAAKREIVALRQSREVLEETILKGMEEHETLAEQRKASELQLQHQRRELAEQQPAWRSRFDELGLECDEHRKERVGLLEGLVGELREDYDRVLLRYKDRAVTTVVADRCPHCNVVVPAQHVVNTLLGKSVHTCQHCGRLVLPEQAIS